MQTYLLLLRGINVGGKNKIPMYLLKERLEEIGFLSVRTFIASGNVILCTDKDRREVRELVEAMLPNRFELDSEIVKVSVLKSEELKQIIVSKPKGFGDDPIKYRYDALFLIDTQPEEIINKIKPLEGVDTCWAGNGVVYFQRLNEQRSKSRLNAITSMPIYKLLTIRNWSTTTKLLDIIEDVNRP